MQEQLAQQAPIQYAHDLANDIAVLSGEEVTISSPKTIVSTKIKAETEPESKQEAVAPTHVEQIRVRADLLDYLTNFAGEVSISRDRVNQQNTAIHQQLREMEDTVSRLQEQLRNLEIETENQILFRFEGEDSTENANFDPLELDRFSMIQQLSRGLTESVSDLNDISRSMDDLVKETETILLQQSRVSADLQQGLMNTRLLPFSGIAPRLERVVRQTNAELAKESTLHINGASHEIDRTVLDKVTAPIEHIVRNAIAHGIETPEQRTNSGKPAAGSITISLERQGSEFLITIADDGQGIDVEKVKQKALSLGLISAEKIPADDVLISLILTSGFSTADNVSQVAGRGVGMDVVSNEIRSLKGRLSIQSTAGKGTTFKIRLPLTLSVIQALLVSASNQQYALPISNLHSGERISVAQIKSLMSNETPTYQFNGEQYDFIPLCHLLGTPLSLPENSKQQLPLLLLNTGTIRVALLVEQVNNAREIVIKSIGKQLNTISALNGATILGDGQVVFIIDIPLLVEEYLAANDHYELLPSVGIQNSQPVAMVVDDSITIRKASGNFLKRQGFEVMTAKDGIDALSQLTEQKPDIILLDIEMPRMDGFEFAAAIRSDENVKHIPIIMITSRTGDKHRQRAADIGVDVYLGKPYQDNELIAAMKSQLGVHYPDSKV
jgi:chemosensory pili system protein ChpA (sensor histidine kinase/response regulator)